MVCHLRWVRSLLLAPPLPCLIIMQSHDIILYLRLRELVWRLPRLLRARRHLNIIQHQLDRLITALYAFLRGPSRRQIV